jgi:photosystem II stability/assembly factor-like uncharacterized protein
MESCRSIPFLIGVGMTAVLLAIPAGMSAQTGPSESYKSRIQVGDLPPSVDQDQAESPEGRIEWMKEMMGGELPAGLRSRILAEAQRLQTLAPIGGDWQSLGPANITRFQNGVNKAKDNNGRLRAILADPRPGHAATVYLLSSGGGLWKTTNFGAQNPTWVPKTDDIYATSGGGAAFGRTPDVIYVGSGDPFDLGVGGIMYKSTNGGDTWSAPIVLVRPTDNQPAARILDVQVDTSQGSTDANDIVLVGTDVGLFRSTNGGASYGYVPVDAFLEGIVDFPPVAGHEDWSLARTSTGWLVSQAYWQACTNCFEQTLVYYSTDRGATWNYIADTGVLGSGAAGRTTLTAGGPNNSVVYALSATNDGNDQMDIYKSTDGGQNFTALDVNSKTPTNPNYFNPDMNLMHGQAWYNQMIISDPADATGQTVYAGGNYSSAVSRDGGDTWTLLTSWLGNLPVAQIGFPPLLLPYAHADFHCAAISTASGKKRIFFGNDGGVFYSDDNGKSWNDNANTGLVTSLIYTLNSGTKHSDDTLVGTQDNGTLYRVNGTTYTGSIGGDGFGTGWSQANNDISMGSLYYLDIRRWTKNPPNNQAKYDRLLSTSNLGTWRNDSYFVTPIATPTVEADPTGHLFYTNTAHYLLKTADGGDSWSAIWTSPGARVIRAVSFGVGLAPDDLDYIGLAGSGGHFVFTHDGGAGWTDVDVAASGIPLWPGFNSTAGWAKNHTTVYLGSGFTGGGTHVAKSLDGGTTWSDATGDLPQLPINKLVVDPSDPSGSIVYIANWIGVYRTVDGGTHWDPVGNGLPLAMVSDMYFPPSGKFLRISSYGRGVWELALQ